MDTVINKKVSGIFNRQYRQASSIFLFSFIKIMQESYR